MAQARKSVKRSPRRAASKLVRATPVPTCFDDPERLAARELRVCALPVSKDLRDGTLRRGRLVGAVMECPRLERPDQVGCRTPRTVHQLQFRSIVPHPDCDDPMSVALQTDQATGAGPQGQLLVSRLVTLFNDNELRRGIHAGNFLWRGPNFLRIRGRMSGTTNAGLYRAPVFDDIERCSQVHVLYGRLCGRVETIDARMLSQLSRAQLIGTYRILIHAERDEEGFRAARVEGVFEGSFIAACR